MSKAKNITAGELNEGEFFLEDGELWVVLKRLNGDSEVKLLATVDMKHVKDEPVTLIAHTHVVNRVEFTLI